MSTWGQASRPLLEDISSRRKHTITMHVATSMINSEEERYGANETQRVKREENGSERPEAAPAVVRMRYPLFKEMMHDAHSVYSFTKKQGLFMINICQHTCPFLR